jgi:histidinol-phosphate aminotransferase|tara:strand:- start:29157 stop:30260 length:1104 start_codon:yes stop_codon:yes gene_type:complete
MNSIKVASYIESIEPYQGGLPIKEVARKLNIAEKNIIKLASNENPLGISPLAKKAITEALSEVQRYPDGNGFYLKDALSQKFNLNPDQLILGNGSNDILELVARTFLSVDDEAIYSEHAFAVYPLVVKSVGAIGREIPARNYQHDLDSFRGAITKKTKVIFIANPNNPTGTLIPKDQIQDFLNDVPSNIIVVLDEAYDEYLDEENKSIAFGWLATYKNLIISRSFSKAYGLAGLRVGFGAGCNTLIELMNRIRQPFNVNFIAQQAAIASLHDEDFIRLSRKINNDGMNQIVLAFDSLGIEYIPSHGNFVSFKLEDETDAMLYYQHLLKNGIILRPIANYKLPEFLRVSVGLKEENDQFIKFLSNCKL